MGRYSHTGSRAGHHGRRLGAWEGWGCIAAEGAQRCTVASQTRVPAPQYHTAGSYDYAGSCWGPEPLHGHTAGPVSGPNLLCLARHLCPQAGPDLVFTMLTAFYMASTIITVRRRGGVVRDSGHCADVLRKLRKQRPQHHPSRATRCSCPSNPQVSQGATNYGNTGLLTVIKLYMVAEGIYQTGVSGHTWDRAPCILQLRKEPQSHPCSMPHTRCFVLSGPSALLVCRHLNG